MASPRRWREDWRIEDTFDDNGTTMAVLQKHALYVYEKRDTGGSMVSHPLSEFRIEPLTELDDSG